MIDALGGVELTLSDEEAEAVNGILRYELNELLGDDENAGLLASGGTQLLSGKQAVAYSRIRYVGNADFERTSRQRELACALTNRARTHAFLAVPALMQDALPYVTTNMDTAELYFLSLRAPFLLGYSSQESQIPADGTWTPDTVDGESVLLVDFAANEAMLRDTAYAAEREAEEAP
jgi:anionic cell wall polymer biosynthesis LytR-Cps2A-Psr (LCP) family protein